MRSAATTCAFVATLLGSASAGSFAVLRFHGDGPLTESCVDPIVNPGAKSAHAHTVMGADNFGTTVSGSDLLKSSCTNANIPADKSNYWMPKLYFHEVVGGDDKFEDVPLYYANVYYFFREEDTDDRIEAFPLGLKILSGDTKLREPPAAGGDIVLDPEDAPGGNVQPAQFICPGPSRPPYPAGSDGRAAGIADSVSDDRGTGFPFSKCNGQYSPLRADLHFPSCYNPDKDLDDYKNNMAWPSRKYSSNGKKNCPPGYIHVPELFFEYYWDTQKFNDRWVDDGTSQPFVLSNGDRTGFSLHGDFISGWDNTVLQQIIDTCDAGTSGMDNCPGIATSTEGTCNIPNAFPSDILTGTLDMLPCNNALSGWGIEETQQAPEPQSEPKPEPKSELESASKPEVEPELQVELEPTSEPESGLKVDNMSEQEQEQKPEPEPNADYSVTETKEDKSHTQADQPHMTSSVTTPAAVQEGGVHVVWETQTLYTSTTVYVDGPEATPGPSGFIYIGCHSDGEDRALSSIGPHGGMTVKMCVSACDADGFALAGLEYGGECFCGNTMNKSEKIDESKCDMGCEGNNSQTCGGSWALSLYSKDGLVEHEKRSVRRSRIHGHQGHRRFDRF